MHRMDEVDRERRRFLGAAAVALGTTWLGAGARTARAPMAFGTLKQIDAGVLNVGYVETGPANGPVVLLLPQEAPEAFAKAIIDVDHY
jgi:hypothetical protein